MKRFVFLLMFIVWSAIAMGQTSANTTQTVSVTLNNVFDIEKVINTPATFSFANAADLENGLVVSNATTLKVRTNKDWKVQVNTSSGFFVGGAGDVPSTILSVSLAGANSFLPLTTTAQTLSTGTKGGAGKTGNTFSLDFKVTPGFDYDAGSYTTSVIYTVSAQ